MNPIKGFTISNGCDNDTLKLSGDVALFGQSNNSADVLVIIIIPRSKTQSLKSLQLMDRQGFNEFEEGACRVRYDKTERGQGRAIIIHERCRTLEKGCRQNECAHITTSKKKQKQNQQQKKQKQEDNSA